MRGRKGMLSVQDAWDSLKGMKGAAETKNCALAVYVCSENTETWTTRLLTVTDEIKRTQKMA